MKKQWVFFVLSGLLPLFLFSADIEVVPAPIDNSVGTKSVVVRGDYMTTNPLRIKVTAGSSSAYFKAEVLQTPEEEGYYAHGVQLFEGGSNTITLQEMISGVWQNVQPTANYSTGVQYNSASTPSLWGRIANSGIHQGEEQRSIFFYPGTRFSSSLQLQPLFGNVNTPWMTESFLRSISRTEILNKPSFFYLSASDDLSTNPQPRKDGIDTKGPADPVQKDWANIATVTQMLDEIKATGVNIITFVSWGDQDATLGDEITQSDIIIPDGSGFSIDPNNKNDDLSYDFVNGLTYEQKQLRDNFWNVYEAPTFPETCNYYVAWDSSLCIEYTRDSRYLNSPWQDGDDSPVKDRVDTPFNIFREHLPDESCCKENSDCDSGSYCFFGTCLKTSCNIITGCPNPERENCVYVPALMHSTCVLKDSVNTPLWYHYYDYDPSSCVEMYGTHDAVEQLFQAAAEKNILVVPTIEFNQFHAFVNEFPLNIAPVKQTIARLLARYGNQPNWLQLYDKEGHARKAIHISQALGLPAGNYTRRDNNTYTITDARAFYMAALNLLSIYFQGQGYEIGFVLDNTAMPTDSIMDGWYAPSAEDIREYLQDATIPSLLGISPFGLPFEQQIKASEQGNVLTWDTEVGLSVEPIENHFMNEAENWKDKNVRQGIPLVINIIPGFDDRWRVNGIPAKFNVYGDNLSWRERNAALAFLNNSAGISLSIWNGYGEGYVWVPYRKRLFFTTPGYSIDSNYLTGPLAIPEERLNLTFAFRGNLSPSDPRYIEDNSDSRYYDPVYEEDIIPDNYCYAGYLFSQDSDGDGVPDGCDNCPDVPNPMVSSSKEILIAPQQTGSDANNAGAYFNTTESPYGLPVKSFTRFEMRKVSLSPFTAFSYPVYYWQPDHDLDGIGDACDPDTATTGFDNVINNSRWGNSNHTIRYENEWINVLYSYYINSYIPAPGTTPVYYDTQDYCWIGKTPYQEEKWGRPGFCTTAYGNGEHGAILNFGYSHGSDPYAIYEGVVKWQRMSWDQNYKTVQTARRHEYPSWNTFNINEPHSGTRVNAQNASGQYTAGYLRHQVPTGETSMQDLFFWNWRNDVVQDLPAYATGLTSTPRDIYGLSSMNTEIAEDDHDFYMAYSAGIKGTNPIYNTGNVVNSDFFHNTKLAARAERYNIVPQPVTYIRRAIPSASIPFRNDKYIIDRETWLAIVGSRFGADPSLDQSWMGLWRYGTDAVPHVDFKRMHEHTLALVVDDKSFVYGLVAGTTGGVDTISAYVNYPDNAGDWTLLGTGIKPDSIDQIVSARIIGNGFYLIGKDTNYATSISSYALYRVSADATGAMTFVSVATLPNDMKGMMLHDLGGVAYVTGARGSVLETYRIEQGIAVLLSSTLKPPARDYSSAYASQDGLYLAGGVTTNQDGSYSYHHDLWELTSTGWALKASNISASMTALFMEKIGDTLYLTSRIPNGEGNVTDQIAYSISNGTVTVNTVTVPELPTAVENYCLSEVDVTIKGGLTGNNGTCIPFTHPWYKQYSIGATVYSVAGKDNRLYVGTGSSIKVYDISDPNALVLKSTFSTSNRIVYDLEVADGDIMYAATSKGLYKLSTANPDTLTIIGSFYSTGSYNYQYRIQLYNNLLYVGDDNGINIRDKNTFARLAYVNIGSTMDFAIANGEIAMYWDAFWDSGIDIRNVDTLARKAWDYPYCSTGELTTDHGAFYLSCDGYEYRFVGLPNTYIDYTELDGDMREMQENHLYNGWVYIPDGSYIKLSTNNNVPSICGNGIVEPGETCDSDSIDCGVLDPNQWDSGTAYCNSTCTAWDTGDCYDSGC